VYTERNTGLCFAQVCSTVGVIRAAPTRESAAGKREEEAVDQAQASELIARAFGEVIDGGDYSKLPELFDEDYVDHSAMGDAHGHEGFIGMLEGFRAALPGFRHEISDVTVVGDSTVVWQVRVLASFDGEMMGVRGKGQPVDLWLTNAARLRGGKLLEHWGPGPEATGRLMAQMGLARPALG
jgi:predicted ester cyclase